MVSVDDLSVPAGVKNLLKELDFDKSGTILQQELRGSCQLMRSIKESLDFDGNGSITSGEIQEGVELLASLKKQKENNSGSMSYKHLPPRISQVMEKWDTDGSGHISVGELSSAADAQEKIMQEGRMMKKIIMGLFLVIVLLLVGMFAVAYAAVELAKEMKGDSSGTMRTPDGLTVKVASADYEVGPDGTLQLIGATPVTGIGANGTSRRLCESGVCEDKSNALKVAAASVAATLRSTLHDNAFKELKTLTLQSDGKFLQVSITSFQRLKVRTSSCGSVVHLSTANGRLTLDDLQLSADGAMEKYVETAGLHSLFDESGATKSGFGRRLSNSDGMLTGFFNVLESIEWECESQPLEKPDMLAQAAGGFYAVTRVKALHKFPDQAYSQILGEIVVSEEGDAADGSALMLPGIVKENDRLYRVWDEEIVSSGGFEATASLFASQPYAREIRVRRNGVQLRTTAARRWDPEAEQERTLGFHCEVGPADAKAGGGGTASHMEYLGLKEEKGLILRHFRIYLEEQDKNGVRRLNQKIFSPLKNRRLATSASSASTSSTSASSASASSASSSSASTSSTSAASASISSASASSAPTSSASTSSAAASSTSVSSAPTSTTSISPDSSVGALKDTALLSKFEDGSLPNVYDYFDIDSDPKDARKAGSPYRILLHSTVQGSMAWMEKTYLEMTPLPSVLNMKGVLNFLDFEAFHTNCVPRHLQSGGLAAGPSVDEMLAASAEMNSVPLAPAPDPAPAINATPAEEDFLKEFDDPPPEILPWAENSNALVYHYDQMLVDAERVISGDPISAELERARADPAWAFWNTILSHEIYKKEIDELRGPAAASTDGLRRLLEFPEEEIDLTIARAMTNKTLAREFGLQDSSQYYDLTEEPPARPEARPERRLSARRRRRSARRRRRAPFEKGWSLKCYPKAGQTDCTADISFGWKNKAKFAVDVSWTMKGGRRLQDEGDGRHVLGDQSNSLRDGERSAAPMGNEEDVGEEEDGEEEVGEDLVGEEEVGELAAPVRRLWWSSRRRAPASRRRSLRRRAPARRRRSWSWRRRRRSLRRRRRRVTVELTGIGGAVTGVPTPVWATPPVTLTPSGGISGSFTRRRAKLSSASGKMAATAEIGLSFMPAVTLAVEIGAEVGGSPIKLTKLHGKATLGAGGWGVSGESYLQLTGTPCGSGADFYKKWTVSAKGGYEICVGWICYDDDFPLFSMSV